MGADESRAPTIENTWSVRNGLSAIRHVSPLSELSLVSAPGWLVRQAVPSLHASRCPATTKPFSAGDEFSMAMRFVQRRFEEESRSAAGSGRVRPEEPPLTASMTTQEAMQATTASSLEASHSDSHRCQHLQLQPNRQTDTAMPATPATTTMAAKPCSPATGSPAKSPLSVQRPTLSPCKRKLSDVSAASPTSLDEVATASSSADERVISPKKKAKAEERVSGDLSKWESHVVASIASALDLDGMADDADKACNEPIAFSAAPAGDLSADELQILCHFLS